MTRKVVSCVLVASIVFSFGCSSSYEVSGTPGAEYSLDSFNVEAYDRSGTIVYQDRTKVEGRNFVAMPDSVHFVNAFTEVTTVVPIRSVQKIILKNHWIGWLEGFGWGALIVASAVAVMAGASPSDGGGRFGSGWTVFFVALGAGAGGVIGGFLGLIIGHSYEYQFGKVVDTTKK